MGSSRLWAAACLPRYLQISYVNDDGQERRRSDPEARTIYRWLRKHGYPEGFQTLCRGCNMAKAHARKPGF
jgi:hypothetical protein